MSTKLTSLTLLLSVLVLVLAFTYEPNRSQVEAGLFRSLKNKLATTFEANADSPWYLGLDPDHEDADEQGADEDGDVEGVFIDDDDDSDTDNDENDLEDELDERVYFNDYEEDEREERERNSRLYTTETDGLPRDEDDSQRINNRVKMAYKHLNDHRAIDRMYRDRDLEKMKRRQKRRNERAMINGQDTGNSWMKWFSVGQKSDHSPIVMDLTDDDAINYIPQRDHKRSWFKLDIKSKFKSTMRTARRRMEVRIAQVQREADNLKTDYEHTWFMWSKFAKTAVMYNKLIDGPDVEYDSLLLRAVQYEHERFLSISFEIRSKALRAKEEMLERLTKEWLGKRRLEQDEMLENKLTDEQTAHLTLIGEYLKWITALTIHKKTFDSYQKIVFCYKAFANRPETPYKRNALLMKNVVWSYFKELAFNTNEARERLLAMNPHKTQKLLVETEYERIIKDLEYRADKAVAEMDEMDDFYFGALPKAKRMSLREDVRWMTPVDVKERLEVLENIISAHPVVYPVEILQYIRQVYKEELEKPMNSYAQNIESINQA